MRQLTPTLEAFLLNLNQSVVPALKQKGFRANVINAREGLAHLTQTYCPDAPKVAEILDDTIPSSNAYPVPIRIFNPNPKEALPVLLYFHGGGGMAGSVTVYDPILRRLANSTQHLVVGIEYRLAPENPYPAAEIDAKTVFEGILPLLKKRKIPHQPKIRIGGDSGGGALAASLAHTVQDECSSLLEALFLVYPSLDYTMSFPSYDKSINGQGYLLESDKIAWYFNHYFSQGEDRHLASPLFAKISPHFPKTLLLTAEFCPLRDEGFAYVERLKKAGVDLHHHHFSQMIHTFMNMEALCQKETDKLYQIINQFLSSQVS